MAVILNTIAFLATTAVAIGLVYLLLNFTVGRLAGFRDIKISAKIYLKDVLFVGLAIFLLLKYTTYYYPW